MRWIIASGLGIAGIAIGVAAALYLPQQLGLVSLLPVAQLADGSRYRGELVDGVLQGPGELRWINGRRYRGDFKAGLFHGEGEMFYPNGGHYSGEFVAGQLQGRGVYRRDFDDLKGENWEQYRGDFYAGRYHGEGELSYSGGETYSGAFVAGQFHGEGEYRDSAGNIYRGGFVDGEFSGEGSWEIGGEYYRGQFRNWLFHGDGSYRDVDGSHYRGEFIDGEFSGKGEYVGQDGGRYRGEFLDWRYHGDGVFEYGTPLLVDGENIEVFSGRWYRGELVASEFPQLLDRSAKQLEHALYQQNELLQRQFEAVAASTPAVEMFVLGLAGDGSQRVFRRELEYLQQLAADELGAAARTVLLANSKDRLQQYPLATASSLRQSLAALAARMGPEDILFLYLSSHGSEDHRFSLQQQGLELADISAEQLAQIVMPLSIQWKVVAVSACYSGGFIAPLRHDNHLLMTAAAADRQSFGCSDDADFTYFGRALLQQSLAEGDGFVAAFERARELVAGWEGEQDFTPSQPQISAGVAIQRQLWRWRQGL